MMALLAISVLLVYSNTLKGPFAYDDYTDVLQNTSIRHLWPLRDVFYISGKGCVTRPIANLSFALDYAIGGLRPFPFHLTNLLIHLGAVLALFGVMHRALALPVFGNRFSEYIPALSLVIASFWGLHPLNTESVSYITQRYESLMGLFVLLTFYCLLRGARSSKPLAWQILGGLSCLLALGSKEVAVSLPVLILLFDVIFISRSFRSGWKERRVLYIGFLLAWVCFVLIQTHTPKRQFAGLELTTPWWRYALNQPAVILHYLKLTIWPHPLVFDYFWRIAATWRPLVPGLVAMIGLLGFTAWALLRKPMAGFLPLAFFAILAPTSSVMPILDLAVEHRMYLPLVPVVISLILCIHLGWVKLRSHRPALGAPMRATLLLGVAFLISSLGILTYLRNEDFRDPMDLWRSVVEAVPSNPRAHNNYAYNLIEAGYRQEALNEYARAVELAPGTPLFQSNYGLTLAKVGRYQEALEHLRIAVKLEPTNARYMVNLANVLTMKGSLDNAIIAFNTAIEVDPKDEAAYSGLAAVMFAKQDFQKAKGYIEKAISLNRFAAGLRYQEIEICKSLKDSQGMRDAFHAAINLEPSAERMADIAWSMHGNTMDPEAVYGLRQALRIKPNSLKSQVRLAWLLAASHDGTLRNGPEALAMAEKLIQSQPFRSPELLDLLAVCQAETGQFEAATASLQEALAQSKTGQEPWVAGIKTRQALFMRHVPYHETPSPS
jgi:Flp pilus assembly protein TadD